MARAAIAIALPEGDAPQLKTRFADALIAAMSGSGVARSENGGLIADYSVSIRSAELGVQASSGQSGSDGVNAPDWISQPRPPKRFDQCEAQVLRGSLLLLDRATGAAAYRGTGTITDCEFGEEALRALADGLVADYLSGSAAPL